MSDTPQPPYILRKPAQQFLDRFADALNEPQSHPLLFNVWGFGGVGKTTLIQRLTAAHKERADFADISFGVTPDIDPAI